MLRARIGGALLVDAGEVSQRGTVALAVVLAVVALAMKGVLSSEAVERLLSGAMAFAAGFIAAGASKGLDTRPPGV